MSRIKAIIYTSSDIENNLVFENEDILAISTNTKCIENENLPEFDIFPNSGTLTVKDRNLDIYNKAINGIFDNYEYKVEYYLENQIIATHIINQRPRYDYDAKTCTFYLGNKLDKLSNQTFTPYVYPLKSETLYDIFKEVLGTIFNIDEDDYTKLMSGIFGNFNVDSITKTNLTFSQYFKQIRITYPYISQTNSREALKTILLIAQCGMYLDKNDKLKLIRLDGYSNATASEYYNNVYKIEPRHINKGFVPSVILDNRFNKFNLDYYKKSISVVNNETVYKEFFDNNTDLLIEYDFSTASPSENFTPYSGDYYAVDLNYDNIYTHTCAKQQVLTASQFHLSLSIPKYANNNLDEILELNSALDENNSIQNPSIIVYYEKIERTQKGYFVNFNENDKTGKSWVFAHFDNIVVKRENLQGNPLDSVDKLYFGKSSSDYDYAHGNDGIEINLNTNIDLPNVSLITKTNNGYNVELSLLLEKDVDFYYGMFFTRNAKAPNNFLDFDESTIQLNNTEKGGYLTRITKKNVQYVLSHIEVSYNGTVRKIIFDKNIVSKKFDENQTFSYEENLQSNLELNQNTSYILGSSTKDSILSNLLKTFNGGLHTGTLTVANTNYNYVNPEYESTEEKITFLGEEKTYRYETFVTSVSFERNFDILFDTINEIELSTSFQKIETGSKDVKINDVSTQINYDIYAKKDTSKKKTTIQIIFYPLTNINEFQFSNFSLTATIKKLKETNKTLFEIGDKVMPYKDKPIINRVVSGVEEPVVFQIVDCETFNESGATFQNLVLREIKKPPTT